MAVQRPHPRIVRLELHHQMTLACRLLIPLPQHLGIASLRVIHVPRVAIPHAAALGQDEEVVAVQMHGVGGVLGIDEIGHVDADIGGFTGVVDVPLGVVGVGDVAAIGFKKDRVAEFEGFELDFSLLAWGERVRGEGMSLLVVGVEGRVVHEPLQAAIRVSSIGAVVSEIDVEIYRKVRVGHSWERVQWLGHVERVLGNSFCVSLLSRIFCEYQAHIVAAQIVIISLLRRRCLAPVCIFVVDSGKCIDLGMDRVVIGADGADVCAHEDGIRRRPICFNKDVSTLTCAQSDHVVVWLIGCDRYQVFAHIASV